MPATLEIKYYNSFWLKKMKTVVAASPYELDGTTANTSTTYITDIPIGSDKITITTVNDLIGAGQTFMYTISSIDYTATILYVSGTEIYITEPTTVLIPGSTTLTFGNIEDFTYVPGRYDSTNDGIDWYIEEARIRGGYNNTIVDLGVKAYTVEDNPNQQRRISSLIYSGLFNSKTGVNNTNQFSVGEDITRTLDPAQGSIQKLYSENTNLTIFQELKVSQALIDKNAVYSADGQPMTTSGAQVIGQIQSYAGNYGISNNPESFAVYGYRKYFVDRIQNVVLRLSQDGITEISAYGMFDFFRTQLSNPYIVDGKIQGAWDIHTKQYIVSIQPTFGDSYTLAFDEDSNGWTSFFSYIPETAASLRNIYYSFKNGNIWKHYADTVNRGSFYGVISDSSITPIFNLSPSEQKSFLTINYEGSQYWQIESIETDSDIGVPVVPFVQSYTLIDLESQLFTNSFKKKENKYFANILNVSPFTSGEILNGQSSSGIKGFWCTVKLKIDNAAPTGTRQLTPKAELFAVSTEYINSSY